MNLIGQIASKSKYSSPSDEFLKAFPGVDKSFFLIDLGGIDFYLFAQNFSAAWGNNTNLLLSNKEGDVLEFNYKAEAIPLETRHHYWNKRDISSLAIDEKILHKIVLKILELKPILGPTKIFLGDMPSNFIQTESSQTLEDYSSYGQLLDKSNLSTLGSILKLNYKWEAVVISILEDNQSKSFVAHPGKLIDLLEAEKLDSRLRTIEQSLSSMSNNINNLVTDELRELIEKLHKKFKGRDLGP